jgi:1-acyl-sn-glycerol-3-phosphate acyltransferase
MLYAILKPCVLAVMRLLWRVKARGREHVPRSGAVLLVANHSSVADPPLVGAVCPRPVSFLAKAELFEIPLFGGLIRRLNAHPVRREGADLGAMRTALRVLERGGTLLVFPEGTRGQEGVLRPGKPGAGMLAVLSGAPVVPVYVSGSGRAWPRGRRLPRPGGKITVAFGPPVRFAGGDGTRDKKESYEAASQAMMAAIARLKDAAQPTAPRAASPRELAFGGVGAGGASTSANSIDGRNGQHGEG